MSELIVYTGLFCRACHDMKFFLERNGVSLVERDVTFDPKHKQELLEINPAGSVPTILFEGKIGAGFDPDGMRELLRI